VVPVHPGRGANSGVAMTVSLAEIEVVGPALVLSFRRSQRRSVAPFWGWAPDSSRVARQWPLRISAIRVKAMAFIALDTLGLFDKLI
jgi:hypothetical protein